MPVELLDLAHGRGGGHLATDEIADAGGHDNADRGPAGMLHRQRPGEDRAGKNGDIGPGLDQSGPGEHLFLFEMLRQDRVFDRPEEGRLHPGQEQREQQQRDRHRLHHDALPRHVEARRADHHQPDFAQLDRADDLRLVAHVGELACQCGQDEERQDEQRRGEPAEPRLGRLVIIDRVNDEQDHGGLVEIVVEGVEQLRDEQRQEPPAPQQMRGCKHDPPGRNPFVARV